MALKRALFLSLLLLPFSLLAETADDYAHRGAQKYIFGDEDGADLLLQQATQHRDTLVRRHQMLVGVTRDFSLADLRLVIAGQAPMLLLGQFFPQFSVQARAHA